MLYVQESFVLDEIISQLKDKKSPKRRSAAKKLRKLKNIDAGPFLLSALKEELKDLRTWETQYQMIMAIGECGYKPALEFLQSLAHQTFEATMVYAAIGDAIQRLSMQNEQDVTSIFEAIDTGNGMLVDGAIRAMAMLKVVPVNLDIEKIINYVTAQNNNDGMHFWVLAAAPGWTGKKIDEYLAFCSTSKRDEIIDAVELARKQKYKKWFPL
ncbi:MAG: HEAT repeat protein [Moritella dasanensis]|jgi:HEAT repeat protein